MKRAPATRIRVAVEREFLSPPTIGWSAIKGGGNTRIQSNQIKIRTGFGRGHTTSKNIVCVSIPSAPPTGGGGAAGRGLAAFLHTDYLHRGDPPHQPVPSTTQIFGFRFKSKGFLGCFQGVNNRASIFISCFYRTQIVVAQNFNFPFLPSHCVE